MHDGQVITLGEISARITEMRMGGGGQGVVHGAEWIDDPAVSMVLKDIHRDAQTEQRAAALVGYDLSALSPYLAGPLEWGDGPDGELLHIAPFASGKGVEQDRPRAFPELLEVVHHAACQMCILEENDLAHGDINPDNILISDDGEAHLIDFDCFRSLDPSVPLPGHIGHPLMMAPELRGGGVSPAMESDRFAFAVWASWVLLGRYPATDLAATEDEVAQVLSQGDWPEHRRAGQAGETPIEALGPDLIALFDDAFAINPSFRPEADTWRRAFAAALDNCWICNCGEAFVGGPAVTHCPWCGNQLTTLPDAVTSHFSPSVTPGPDPTLKIQIIGGPRFGASIADRQTITIGRATLPALPPAVSSRHLEITRAGDRFLFRHIGRNDTLVRWSGEWRRLDDVWVEVDDLKTVPLEVRLADAEMVIEVA